MFRYRGLDELLRTSCDRVLASRRRASGAARSSSCSSSRRRASNELYIEVGREAAAPPSRARHRAAAAQARARMRTRGRRGARVRSGGPLFDAWMQRSRADLALLTSELETGPYPYAGMPWFSTPFGRDAVITALQTLVAGSGHRARRARLPGRAPGAGGVVVPGFRARQDHARDAQGRDVGAAASCRSAATTAAWIRRRLFVDAGRRLCRAHRATCAFIDTLWPALRSATGWIERVCDANPDGFLDYARGESTGLSNQGWKDSEDSVFHADGRFPQGPIALVEVQGYAFAAFRAMADAGARCGATKTLAAHWEGRAERMRAAVEAALLDGGRRASTASRSTATASCARCAPAIRGTCCIADCRAPSARRRWRQQLMTPHSTRGWGVRTLAQGEARYNPMSYHNGSIWPHDTALCAAGIARYGHREAAVQLLRSAFEAAVHFDMRLPELFCGFPRVQGAPPIAYPVACMPQAWAAGAPFMLLQACLGVQVDGLRGEVHRRTAALADWHRRGACP